MKRLLALAMVAAFLACAKEPVGVELTVCPDDGYSMDGCTDIVGRVVTMGDSPVAGAYATTRSGTLDAPLAATDSDGRFRLRILCPQGCPASGAEVWIRAFVVNKPGWTGSTIESVAVRPVFASVGQVPDSTFALITFGQP